MASACKTILASTIARPFVDEIKSGIARLNRKPLLVGFLANSDPAAKMYAQWTEKTCRSIGVGYELRTIDRELLEENIVSANKDESVDGIMVYFPVFGTGQDQYLQQVVSPTKDVEGLSHIYVQNMYHNIRYLDEQQTQKSILPCTPLAIVKTLEHLGVYNRVLPYGNRLYGRTVTIVNRSEIVGRPLAALLANDGASVYSVDMNGVQRFTRGDSLHLKSHEVADVSIDVQSAARESDVIITGVPTPDYKFPTEYIRNGAVCVNFSTAENFDDRIKERASLYVPTIGKVTIAMLLRNLLRLIDHRVSH